MAPVTTPPASKIGCLSRVIWVMPSLLLTPVSLPGSSRNGFGVAGTAVWTMTVSPLLTEPGTPARSMSWMV